MNRTASAALTSAENTDARPIAPTIGGSAEIRIPGNASVSAPSARKRVLAGHPPHLPVDPPALTHPPCRGPDAQKRKNDAPPPNGAPAREGLPGNRLQNRTDGDQLPGENRDRADPQQCRDHAADR